MTSNGSKCSALIGRFHVIMAAVLCCMVPFADVHAQQAVTSDFEVMVGRSKLLEVPDRIAQVFIVDPSVADAEMISSRSLLFYGRKIGVTDVIIRLEGGAARHYEVAVQMDHVSLQQRLDDLFGRGIVVDLQGGVLVLGGTVANVDRAVQLEQFMKAAGHEFVDMTYIPGVQQVLLKVRIAEVSRQGMRQLAFSAVVGGSSAFGGFQPGADGRGSFNPVGITPASGSGISPSNYVYQNDTNLVTSAATLFGGIPAADLALYINALKQNSYVRVLAEPNLVAVSGEEADFLVGGEFPVPVVQGTSVGVGSSLSIEYKEVGVRLRFRPEVLGENRIRLQVAPEVSNLSETFGAVNLNNISVPGVLTRRSSTTVELRSGQTFALAGLLKSTTEAQNSSVPLLGDLPIIGPLFRSIRYKEDQTELIVLVTAELVEPIDPVGMPVLPGFLHERPGDWSLFVDGRIAGSVIAPLPEKQGQMARKLGLNKLVGPGAWRRYDDPPNPPRPDPTSSLLGDAPDTAVRANEDA